MSILNFTGRNIVLASATLGMMAIALPLQAQYGGGYPPSSNPGYYQVPGGYPYYAQVQPVSGYGTPGANDAPDQAYSFDQNQYGLLTASKNPTAPAKTFIGGKSSESLLNETSAASDANSKPLFGSSKKSSDKKQKRFHFFGEKKEEDDGQAEIEAAGKELQYSERDYIASATASKNTSSKNLYSQGMDSEAQGDFKGAIQSYCAFIQANKKSTDDGTLAAPYHRLALIAWKQKSITNAGIYFRYAMRYAQEGNLLIISGDYALFLMEQNQMDQAEIVLRNSLVHDPENKRLLLYLGRCTGRQNKSMESYRYFAAAVGEEQAYQELASIYRQQNDFESAARLDYKRQEYLAKMNRGPMPAPYQYAMQQNGGPVSAPPTTPYPPRGMMGQANFQPNQAIPYPTPNDPDGRRSQAAMQVPGGTPGYLIQNVVPENSWRGVYPESRQAPAVSPSAGTPVSKVYHYQQGIPSPVYQQYSGNDYPGAKASPTPNPQPQPQLQHPWANSANNYTPATESTQSGAPQNNNVGLRPNAPYGYPY